MRVDVDTTGLDAKFQRLASTMPELGRAIVTKGTLAAVSELTREAPVGKSVAGNPWQPPRIGGRLRGSITFTISPDGTEGKAGPTVKYAPCVVMGTRPHVIHPREKKALYWTGAIFPRRTVQHPGTRPNDFITRAAEAVSVRHMPLIAELELRRFLAGAV